MKWQLTIVLTLIAAGLAAWLLLNSVDTGSLSRCQGELAPHRITDLTVLRYNEQGNPAYRLTAVAARYYRSQQQVDFEEPQLQLLAVPQVSWLIQAHQARLLKKQQLTLQGGIVGTSLMQRSLLQGVRTEQLQLDLDSGALSGDCPVLLYGEHWVTQGNGLQGNFNQRVLTVLNAVRTHYDGQP